MNKEALHTRGRTRAQLTRLGRCATRECPPTAVRVPLLLSFSALPVTFMPKAERTGHTRWRYFNTGKKSPLHAAATTEAVRIEGARRPGHRRAGWGRGPIWVRGRTGGRGGAGRVPCRGGVPRGGGRLLQTRRRTREKVGAARERVGVGRATHPMHGIARTPTHAVGQAETSSSDRCVCTWAHERATGSSVRMCTCACVCNER
jgi:hypothetical protein